MNPVRNFHKYFLPLFIKAEGEFAVAFNLKLALAEFLTG